MKNKHNYPKVSKLFLLSLAIGLFTSACALYQVDSNISSDSFYPPKESGVDVVYLETVTRPHEVIGTVTVNTERIQDLQDVVIKMKREAAILGGDAITDIRTNGGTGTWARIKPQKLMGNANVRANFVADVVVFK